MRAIKTILATALATAFATPAIADDVDFLGYANGSETVNYSLTSPNATHNSSANAGGFLTSVNGGPTFVSYCVDLYQNINFADPAYSGYNLVSSAAHFFQNPNGASLISRFLGDNHTQSNSAEAAAFQIALWELTYETSGIYNLADGTAIFSGGSAANAALGIAQGWLSALGNNAQGFAVYESSRYQDVLVTPVPEPSTYAMMVAGLAGLGYMARRRRERQQG